MSQHNPGDCNSVPGQTIDFKSYCRDIADFPKQGIVFRDITNLLKDGPVWQGAIDTLAAPYLDVTVDSVAAIEARGFIVGAALAYRLGCGFVPVRKQGKLPWKVYRQSYDLEYGQDHVEIHQDAVLPGQNILIVDDVIATGGTVSAVAKLIREMRGNIVGAAFLVELTALNGREKLPGVPVFSLIKY